MMGKKISLFLSSVAFALLTGALIRYGVVPPVHKAQAGMSEIYEQIKLFGDAFEKTRDFYIDTPDQTKMIESALNGMLSSLDPHSSYMDTKSYQDMQVQTKGEFGGLGLEITQQDGLVKVVTPIDDTPAFRAGILAGDLISAINGERVQGLTLDQARDKMRGPPKTSVTLLILRGEKREPIEFKIVRDMIKLKAVRSRREGDVGYIRIIQFSEQTFDGLKEAMDKLTTEITVAKLKGFIVDLRNNPGGLLDQAIAVSDAFIEQGEIVSTRGRRSEEVQRFTARQADLSKGQPLVVLINGGSASASEIVAGALKDYKRAILIGTRSFGKGSVQTVIPMGSGGALRLTTARYFTPEGISIQAKGIQPDIQVLQNVPEELKDRSLIEGEASFKGHLKNSQEEASPSQAYIPHDVKEDTQLQAALALLRGEKSVATLIKESHEPPKDLKDSKGKESAQGKKDSDKTAACDCSDPFFIEVTHPEKSDAPASAPAPTSKPEQPSKPSSP